MISDDIPALRDALRDLVHAGYRIDIDDKEILRVWFRALRRQTLDDIKAAVDRLLTSHDTATIRPKDIHNAIREIRSERHQAEQGQFQAREPETVEEMLRRRRLPWTVKQYEMHHRRTNHAMQLRLRGAAEDKILAWLRERKDVGANGVDAKLADVPDGLLADEEKTVSEWFESKNERRL